MGGNVLSLLAEEENATAVCGVDLYPKEIGIPVYTSFADIQEEADVIIDFSHHSAVESVMTYARENNLAVVVGTTGHTEEEKQIIFDAARQIPVFYSGNMSLGIAVLCRLAKEAARSFPDADIEIVEIHHIRKVDAPSGTAKMLFEAVKEVRPNAVAHCGRAGEGKREKNEIGISALRMGNVVGIHEVHICTPSQTLTLRHEAANRAMFADGAVDAARFVAGKPAGLYNMDHVVESL
jgi:4-hydroxy-tetrahydrodipicolinate reductase